jgi:hypothetical protein
VTIIEVTARIEMIVGGINVITTTTTTETTAGIGIATGMIDTTTIGNVPMVGGAGGMIADGMIADTFDPRAIVGGIFDS